MRGHKQQLHNIALTTVIDDLRAEARDRLNQQSHYKGLFDPLVPSWITKYPADVTSWLSSDAYSWASKDKIEKSSFNYVPILQGLEFCFTKSALRFLLVNSANPHDFWLNLKLVLDGQFGLTKLNDDARLPISLDGVKKILLGRRYCPVDFLESEIANYRTRLLVRPLEKELTATEAVTLFQHNIVLSAARQHVRGTMVRIDPLMLHPLVRIILNQTIEAP